jgi:lipoate-protein ligase A
MIFRIDNKGITEPHINLAMEEFCLRSLPPKRSYFIVYVNRPSVIIGRHQNILSEVDLRFAEQAELQVVRRISGGGAVYHDFGNLNFCFIHGYNRRSLSNVRQTITPIQAALVAMGVPAVFNGKNDLFITDKKISGNAQFSNTRRILVHGTLLFDSNLDYLKRALNPQTDHITSIARKSVSSRVTNISPYLMPSFGIKAFRRRLLDTVDGQYGGMQTVRLEDSQWQTIARLSEEKYLNWNWNYGKAPVFQIKRCNDGPLGRLGYSIDVENGCIAAIRFEKEGTGVNDTSRIEEGLLGAPFRREAIRVRLNQLGSKVFDGPLNAIQLTDFLSADLGRNR